MKITSAKSTTAKSTTAKSTTAKFTAALAVATLGLVACGSSDDQGAASDATVVVSVAESGTDAPPAAPAASDPTVDVTGTAASDATATSGATVTSDATGAGGSGSGSGDTSEFCQVLEDTQSAPSDPQTISDSFHALQDSAPDELADATGVIVSLIDERIAISTLPEDEQTAALDESNGREEEYTAALDTIETYARDNCDNLDDSFFDS